MPSLVNWNLTSPSESDNASMQFSSTIGDKVDGCAVCWRLAAGIKVVAVGDSVKLMGVQVVSGTDKGVDCMSCG